MDSKLIAVSLDGKIDDFYDLTRECPNILEEVDKMLVDNPMHLAAINGHTHFAVGMMRLKPSFAKRLNPDGFSPLQLALQNAHIQTVLRLLAIDKDLVRVQGRQGMSPLHYVAKHGNNELLSVFLRNNPTALEDVTIHNQTALHIVLENDKVDCVETLLKCYDIFPQSTWKKRHLNWKDENGNTPLHIATTRKQTQVVKALIDRQLVDVNATTLAGLTALGISEQPDGLGSEEISKILRLAGASATGMPPRSENTIEPSLSKDERLKAVAEGGDIDMLYTLIQEDPYLLDNIDRIPLIDTPLHIAASAGQIRFARETMLLKPSFARKLNQNGFTPLHLALLKGHTNLVNQLLDADSDLVRVQGKEGKTPLHYAAEQVNIHFLRRFLSSCPSSIQDVTNSSETALHIAIEKKNFLATCLIVAQLQTDLGKGSRVREEETLNKQNHRGNTALHIAVKTSQPEVVRVLIEWQIKLNVKNSDSLTALDILEGDSQINNSEAGRAMKKMLRRAGARSTTPRDIHVSNLNHELDALEGQPQVANVRAILPLAFTTAKSDMCLKILHWLEPSMTSLIRSNNNLSDESRNMLLVALVLIATITYQGVLTPPGDLLREDNNNNLTTTRNNTSSSSLPQNTVTMDLWIFSFIIFNGLALLLTTHAINFLLLSDQREPLCLFIGALITSIPFFCFLISLPILEPRLLASFLLVAIILASFFSIPPTYRRIKRNLESRIEIWMSHNAT